MIRRQDTAAPPLVLAHYMAWYASKAVSGQWGWHWTMNRFDPDRKTTDGLPEIASHVHPLMGPYDSGDPLALDCHAQLMKYAGIDGVVADWYGIKDFWDYGAIHRNTGRLLERVQKAGLKFAVCYEDQSVKHMVENKAIPAGDALAHGKEVLRWLDQNWFRDSAYVTIENRPLLLVFGPQFFAPEQWDALFSGLRKRPFLLTLNTRQGKPAVEGAFVWPQVSGGKTMPPDEWRRRLTDFYGSRDSGPYRAGVAYPGFHDIYKEAGLHESYGFIDTRDGKTFDEMLGLAQNARVPLLQLATWNDYGEGTVIEPTEEAGYRYLEAVQAFQAKRRRGGAAAFPYTPDDLRLPIALYRSRTGKRQAKLPGGAELLERVSDLLTRL